MSSFLSISMDGLRKGTILFAVFSHFSKSQSEKKSLVLVVVGVGIKKRMKQNAETAESKSFIAFV